MAPTTTEMNPAERRKMMIRAVVSSAVGTTIEWYDFFLYGVAAALVFPQKFFPGSDPLRRDAAVVLDLLRRLRRAAGRRGALRPLRRPHRPQGDADRHARADGRGHDGHRPGARLRPHRHLGRGAADVLPRPAGDRRGRRMGRRRAHGRRMDRPEAPRLHHQLRAVRRAGRHGARQRRAGAGVVHASARRRSSAGAGACRSW